MSEKRKPKPSFDGDDSNKAESTTDVAFLIFMLFCILMALYFAFINVGQKSEPVLEFCRTNIQFHKCRDRWTTKPYDIINKYNKLPDETIERKRIAVWIHNKSLGRSQGRTIELTYEEFFQWINILEGRRHIWT